MAYAFNDDKTKVTVYTKDDFVIVSGTQLVPKATSAKQGTATAEIELRHISDTSAYQIISVNQEDIGIKRGQGLYQIQNTVNNYPNAIITNGKLRVFLFNDDTTADRTVSYRVLLMKLG